MLLKHEMQRLHARLDQQEVVNQQPNLSKQQQMEARNAAREALMTDASAVGTVSFAPEESCGVDDARQQHFLKKFQAESILGTHPRAGNGSRNSHEARSSLAIAAQRETRAKKVDRCIILPHSRFRTAWDAIAVTLILYIAIALPYRLAFEALVTTSSGTPTDANEGPASVDPIRVLDFLVDCFFMLDIGLNFRSAFIDIAGNVVTSQREMACHYLRTWLVLDLVASFPFDWMGGLISFTPEVVSSSNSDSSLVAGLPGMLRLFKLLKLLRLLRVARVLQLLGRLEQNILEHTNSQSLRLVAVLGAIIMAAHWSGCLQFTFASVDTEFNATADTHTLHPETWIARADLEDKPAPAQWMWSFYHAMIQLLAISTGVVPPKRNSEMWLYLIAILLGATLYAVFVASITSIFADSFASGRLYRTRLDQMLQYMRHTHIPKEMCQKLRAHFELTFPSKTMYDEEGITASLSHPLRGQIALRTPLYQSNDLLAFRPCLQTLPS